MNISLQQWQSIYDCASSGAEIIGTQTGKLLGKTYVFIQTQPGSYLTVIFANLISFEIALKIARFINSFCKYQEDEVDQNQQPRLMSVLLFSSVMVGSITACCKTLSIPLSFWKVTALSFSTCMIYLFRKTVN